MAKAPILLVGSYGRGNIGDDVFLLAALKLFAGHPLYINSADDSLLPAEARTKVTTIATSGMGDLAKKLKVFFRVRHIVYCGGDLWVELSGDKRPRQSLYKMIPINLLARLLGKRVHYIGCGVGELRGYSLFLARFSARLASSIAVRESRSADLLGLKNITILPDLAVNLDYPQRPARSGRQQKFRVGISLLYFVPSPKENFPKLLDGLEKLIKSLPAKNFEFILFPMLVTAEVGKDDLWACHQLRDRVADYNVSVFELRDVHEYIKALSGLDILVGTRLHANILAALAGTPALGIAYRPKVSEFFAANGLADYCLDLNQLALLPGKLQDMRGDIAGAQQQFAGVSKGNLKQRKAYQKFIAAHF